MQTQLPQGQPVVGAGQPISLQNQQPQIIIINNVKEKNTQIRTFNASKSKTLGILQIFCGVFAIIFNTAAAVINYSSVWIMSGGWWGSPFMITAGGFGIAAAKYKNRCMIKSTLAFSIISCLITIPLIIQCALSLSNYNWFASDKRGPHMAMNSLLLIVTLVELASALYHSILCCMATSACCREMTAVQGETSNHSNQQIDQSQFVYFNSGMTSNQQPQIQLQQMPQQQQMPQFVQQPMQQHVQQQHYIQQQMPHQEVVQQQYAPQAAATSMPVASPSAPLGTVGGPPPGPQGAMGSELPPAYDDIDTEQFGMDAKINDWAARELQLGKR